MSECYCSCSCSTDPLLVFACAGGSNVGQISNAAAVEMDKLGIAKIYCLTGVAAHIQGMVGAANSAGGIIAVDGCPVCCVKTALDHVGIMVSQHIVVTDLGIEKNHKLIWDDNQVETVINAVNIPEKF